MWKLETDSKYVTQAILAKSQVSPSFIFVVLSCFVRSLPLQTVVFVWTLTCSYLRCSLSRQFRSTKKVELTLKMCFYPSLSCLTFSQIFVLSPLVYNHVTHPDVCVDSSAAQTIVGEKSRPACTLQNVTGYRRTSWYFWLTAFYKLCNLGHDRHFSGTLTDTVVSVLEGRESIYTA